MTQTTWTLIAAALSIGLLLGLVIWVKLQAFIALLIASIGFGLATGTNPTDLVELVVEEMGGGLGQVALVVGLGAVFGHVLQRAGAAEQLASTLINRFSERNVAWGLGFAGFLVSIAVFIDVAIVILVPMLYTIAKRTGKSLLYYGIPLCAGVSVTHTFIPPTPGPIATAGVMNADLGLVILFGVLCGLPAMAVAGPIFGRWISKKIFVPVPEELDASREDGERDPNTLPRFGAVVGALLLPLVLILAGTTSEAVLPEGNTARTVIAFIGHPVIALLLTCLYTLYFFGVRRGSTREDLQKMTTSALGPAGVIILITGAGSVFGGLLVDSGMGDVLADWMSDMNMPLVLFGFITASIIRISQGSGTVAMITGATLTAPVASTIGASDSVVALTCIAIASGAAAFSHVNDSGFWMANRYFGMSVADTLKSWTVMKTIVGVTGCGVALTLSAFVG
ncbi:GntP family permease [Prauserella rugosa]|uniref:GntP family gluconate:H+ symporter/Gnt-I system low-affinity gluconate transporter n=1 Tax=Prauserella rugosa TaxID=43354 RepID=A0A660C9K4_9PSEU|nr:gluconate:H+ symporter [Prauserella rugosa]KMS82408.1 gluconate transporter [Streptomyces regensis]TWH20290.1 GntP family gluconate:H+ symporter/Gnt-I system low-affinity gluconate transporter [Prauserella rugosa]